MISPICGSAAEMDAVAAICSLVSTSLALFSSVSVILSTAFSMPLPSTQGTKTVGVTAVPKEERDEDEDFLNRGSA